MEDSTATVTVLKEFCRCLESHLEGSLTQILEISWTFPGNVYVVVHLSSVFLRCLGKIELLPLLGPLTAIDQEFP